TLYGHNKEVLVKEGEVVSKGQTVALLGSTGRSSGPHVHFEVHKNGKIVDPLRYVRSK
ncbi:MAG: M23 family metallopeptidase, partial [Gammaproteobacteria bacterium]|nr:M23 family metallopeptidase [Gammaproteobacteria bacterium]